MGGGPSAAGGLLYECQKRHGLRPDGGGELVTSRVLLDASFWIALRDPREPWHTQARQATIDLLKQRTSFVFTTLVLAETHAHFARSSAIRTQILDDAQQNPTLHWEPITPTDEAEAVRLLREQRDKSYSLCDAVSF